jgi:hypothetical protein
MEGVVKARSRDLIRRLTLTAHYAGSGIGLFDSIRQLGFAYRSS